MRPRPFFFSSEIWRREKGSNSRGGDNKPLLWGRGIGRKTKTWTKDKELDEERTKKKEEIFYHHSLVLHCSSVALRPILSLYPLSDLSSFVQFFHPIFHPSFFVWWLELQARGGYCWYPANKNDCICNSNFYFRKKNLFTKGAPTPNFM